MSAKELVLSNGALTLVDEDIYSWIINEPVTIHFTYGYATVQYRVRLIDGVHYPRSRTLLHRLINKTPDGFVTDHINGNPLDNRRCNLRSVKQAINSINVHAPTKNKNGYRGVYKAKTGYIAYMAKKYLGTRKTAKQAHKLYLKERDRRLGTA